MFTAAAIGLSGTLQAATPQVSNVELRHWLPTLRLDQSHLSGASTVKEREDKGEQL